MVFVPFTIRKMTDARLIHNEIIKVNPAGGGVCAVACVHDEAYASRYGSDFKRHGDGAWILPVRFFRPSFNPVNCDFPFTRIHVIAQSMRTNTYSETICHVFYFC